MRAAVAIVLLTLIGFAVGANLAKLKEEITSEALVPAQEKKAEAEAKYEPSLNNGPNSGCGTSPCEYHVPVCAVQNNSPYKIIGFNIVHKFSDYSTEGPCAWSGAINQWQTVNTNCKFYYTSGTSKSYLYGNVVMLDSNSNLRVFQVDTKFSASSSQPWVKTPLPNVDWNTANKARFFNHNFLRGMANVFGTGHHSGNLVANLLAYELASLNWAHNSVSNTYTHDFTTGQNKKCLNIKFSFDQYDGQTDRTQKRMESWITGDSSHYFGTMTEVPYDNILNMLPTLMKTYAPLNNGVPETVRNLWFNFVNNYLPTNINWAGMFTPAPAAGQPDNLSWEEVLGVGGFATDLWDNLPFRVRLCQIYNEDKDRTITFFSLIHKYSDYTEGKPFTLAHPIKPRTAVYAGQQYDRYFYFNTGGTQRNWWWATYLTENRQTKQVEAWKTAPRNGQEVLAAFEAIGKAIVALLPTILTTVASFDPTGISAGVALGCTALNTLIADLWGSSGTSGFKEHDLGQKDNGQCFNIAINFDEKNPGYRFKMTTVNQNNQVTWHEETTVDPIPKDTIGKLLEQMQSNNRMGGAASAIVGVLNTAKKVVDEVNQYTNPATAAAAKQVATAAQFAKSPSGASLGELGKVAGRIGLNQASSFVPMKLDGFDQVQQMAAQGKDGAQLLAFAGFK